MSDKDIHKHLMTHYFTGTAPDGYDLFAYYGVMVMKYKKNGTYQIKLQYDYKNRNMVNGKGIEFDDFKAVMKAYEILENHSMFQKEENKKTEMQKMLLGED